MSTSSESSSVMFAAGALSGLAEALVVQPIDMVTVRQQISQGRHESILETFRNVYREGGFFRFYRGMAPELAGMIPKSSAMFASYEMTKVYMGKTHGDTSQVAAFAGLVSGVPEALTVQPFQLVKIRLQAKEHVGRYNGPIDCIQKTYQQEGIVAFSNGLLPTIYRNCAWNAVYFGTMHKLKTFLPQPDTPSHFLKAAYTAVTGSSAAAFATIFSAPFDVVKSRMQSQLKSSDGTPLKYRNTFQSLRTVWKEEGLGSMYKGFKPKVLRSATAGAVSMMCFEFVLNVCK